jgi:HD-GYP domain-containing protein (c-di-GMP phosphodiesterase class II)
VDAFEAMTRGRPYRERLSVDQAVEGIKKEAGSQFDPDVVGAFERLKSARGLPTLE